MQRLGIGIGHSVTGRPGRQDEQNGVHTDANFGGAGPAGAEHESQVEWHPWNARTGKTQGRAAVLHQAKREGHRPGGNPVSGGHQAAEYRGGELPRWSTYSQPCV